MSMNACLARVRPELLAACRDEPERAVALVETVGLAGLSGSKELADLVVGAMPRPVRWMMRWPVEALVRRVVPDAPASDEDEAPGASGSDRFVEVIHLDKDWHAIHWLLTGSADDVDGPLGGVVFGSEPIGDEEEHDMGYGPPCGLDPAEVRAIHGLLAALGYEAILARWDRRAMIDADLYGGHWDDDDRESVSENLGRLLRFYADAAGAGDGVLAWIQ